MNSSSTLHLNKPDDVSTLLRANQRDYCSRVSFVSFDYVRARVPILLSLRYPLLRYIIPLWPTAKRRCAALPVIFYKRPGRTQSTSEIMTLIKRVGLRGDDSRPSIPLVHYPRLEEDQRVFRDEGYTLLTIVTPSSTVLLFRLSITTAKRVILFLTWISPRPLRHASERAVAFSRTLINMFEKQAFIPLSEKEKSLRSSCPEVRYIPRFFSPTDSCLVAFFVPTRRFI